MAFQSTNPEYNIISDSEISAVLSHFSPEMAFDTINFILQNKFEYYRPGIGNGNIITGYETLFKTSITTYPEYNGEFKDKRDDLYRAIIQNICNFHALEYRENPAADIYTTAFYLYDFLVSNFSEGIILFFTKYITKEKNNIFDSLQMQELRKNKDSSALYSKKVYDNSSKLAVIHANMEYVLTNLLGFDISFEDIISILYNDNKPVANLILSCICDTGDFYKNFYVRFVSTHLPEMITAIRLQLPSNVPTVDQNWLSQ